MATLLDIGILTSLTPIFSLLFVIAVVFGVLSMTKLFGDNKGLHILIAFILGVMVLMVPDVSRLIATMMPWFTFFFIFVIFLLVIYKMFGATDADIAGVLKADSTIGWIVLIICLVIVAGSAGVIYGPSALKAGRGEVSDVDVTAIDGAAAGRTDTGSYYGNLGATLFHPKVLGFILIALISVLTIAILAMKPR